MKLAEPPPALKEAFRSGRLSLYLGAGVSKPSGLPNWEELVLMLYFKTIKADIDMYVHPNYLLAISEWLLKKKNEPLEVVVRKIKRVWGEEDFYKYLKETLYFNFLRIQGFETPDALLHGNPTLGAIANCCKSTIPRKSGISSIITYNYDDLLETAMLRIGCGEKFQTIFKGDQNLDPEKVPIYHVHGYLPVSGESASGVRDLIFSEEQYNNVYQDAYFWGNMVQMQYLSSTVGLMIGTSLVDRNVRRLLDAVRRSPLSLTNYLLLQKPNYAVPEAGGEEMKWIKKKAMENIEKVLKSGVKEVNKEEAQVGDIIKNIFNYESAEFDDVYKDFGVNVIWYEKHEEIPAFLERLIN